MCQHEIAHNWLNDLFKLVGILPQAIFVSAIQMFEPFYIESVCAVR